MEDMNKKELFEKAIELHQSGNIDEADKIYVSILDDDNDNFAANFLHGCVLSDRSEFAESVKFLETALRLQPDKNGKMRLQRYCDASFNVHEGAKSHAGIYITLGGGGVVFKSYKIKCYAS